MLLAVAGSLPLPAGSWQCLAWQRYLNTLLYILQRQSLLGDYPTRLQKLRQLFAAILYIRDIQEATVKATIAEQTVTLHINALNVPEPDELPSDSEPEQ